MKGEKDTVARQHEKTRWREVLYEFTQNTTIHALKQITEPTPFCIRRVIWVLILAFGLLLFGIQVVESIIYYWSNPVAVNIMINYNDTLRFPAITICNQNAFRMTKASQGGEFDAIETLFSHNHIEHLSNESAARYARVLDTPLSQLYMDLSHKQEDFIVSCKWEQQDCSMDDFEKTLTDHGVCYTFNNAANLSLMKNATQTGALWGLRLRLNIEQYEYMMGPNDGAGVRVLVHSQGDFPLVGDFGQSVPPGLHAFLGIMIVEIQDLPAPHGQCQDDVQLEHFEHYTQAACIRECKQRIVLQQCGCSYGVLPNDAPAGYPACTLREQFHCVDPTLNHFPEYRQMCKCPYPCLRTHFDSDITYGDMSKFDMEKILFGNLTDLKGQYAFARETAQSAKKEIVQKDIKNARALAKSVHGMDKILDDIPDGLERMMKTFQADAEIMKQKIWFHLKFALKKVKYAVEHDFVRGWEIVEERTFNHVATGFWEIVSSFDRVLELLNSRYSDDEISQRELFWYGMDDRLYNRLTMAQRALTNLTEVNDAYSTGDPLLRFRITLDRRYDMTFIPVHLVIRHPKTRTEHFEECRKQIQKYISAIEAMRECGDWVVAKNTSQCADIGINRDKFIKSAKMVNYKLFQFRTQVLMKPVEAAEAIITDFTSRNESLWKEYVFLKGIVEVVKKDVVDFTSSSWLNIKTASGKFNNYTQHNSITKTSLANDLNSGRMEDDVISFQHFFQNLRSRSREIKDSCTRLRDLYIDVFSKMAEEKSTLPFYTKLHEDALAFLKNPPNATEYVRHFSYLTKLSKSHIRNESETSLLKVLNADFYNMNIAETIGNIRQFFDNELLPAAEIEGTIDNLDESLGTLLKDIRKDLSTFTESTKIGYDFFRENYLNLDIYMRALSYEAITQQIAYDMTNLWSDIGGSIGLFIGASAISVFEILDIFLHTSCKMGREKHLKRKRSRKNDNDINAMDKLNSERFSEYRKKCHCPYPCRRTEFDIAFSYGGISYSDVERSLYGNISQLQDKYNLAQETAQTAKRTILQKSRYQAATLALYLQKSEEILQGVSGGLKKMIQIFTRNAEKMRHRIWFHYWVGLRNVKFVVEHDFIRGWEAMEERTFNHMATGYWEIISSYDRVLQILLSNASSNDTFDCERLWYEVDDRLYNRLTMAERALANLTKVNHAYSTGTKILNYKVTLDRRYDLTFIPVSLFRAVWKRRQSLFDECESYLLKFISAIENMRSCGKQTVIDHVTHCNDSARDDFIFAAYKINYRLFSYKTSILESPLRAIDKTIAVFIKMNETLWQETAFLSNLSETISKEIADFTSATSNELINASNSLNEYVSHNTMTKSTLSEIFNSPMMVTNIIKLKYFYHNLRSRSQEIIDSCKRLNNSYIDIFRAMAKETSTSSLYKTVYNDINSYFNHLDMSNNYIPHFASLLQRSKEDIKELNKVSLLELMNADFYNMNIANALANITHFFEEELLPYADFDSAIGNHDNLLITQFKEIQNDLAKFTSSTHIGSNFFRDNYVNIDVYMRELNYKEISIQVAYDITNLWSDIGGSFSLFLGASALSVFELLDVFIHTSVKMLRETHIKGNGGQKPETNR